LLAHRFAGRVEKLAGGGIRRAGIAELEGAVKCLLTAAAHPLIIPQRK
jgi:hypothetical protein